MPAAVIDWTISAEKTDPRASPVPTAFVLGMGCTLPVGPPALGVRYTYSLILMVLADRSMYISYPHPSSAAVSRANATDNQKRSSKKIAGFNGL